MTSRLLRASLGSPDYDGIRAALRRDTTAVVARERGATLLAAALPLLRDGHQAVRVSLDGGEPGAEFALLAGGRVVARSDGGALLMAPEVSAEQEFTLQARRGGRVLAAGPLTLRPQRRWQVFIVHHSHLDIGYTDPQGTVLRNHLAYLDGALALTEQTDGWPDDARFRWSVESNLPALRWLAARPAAAVAAFTERVRQGRIEVTAFPFQSHTEACSDEELARVLRFTGELRDRYGIEVRSAMHTDVPGAVTGVVDALATVGVRYLAAAHNWAGRSVPYLTGGEQLARPFRWRAPSGNELLVWFTDTPHGMAYMEGNTVGLADGYELTEDLLPRYLDALGSQPYPYGPEAFGWSGLPPDAPVRAPYALDAVHLRVQGAHADNAGPNLLPAEIVRRWNQTWDYPRLRMATNSEFFEHVERTAPAEAIGVHEGDWTDWWADGLGSGARPLGYVRRAQSALRAAETLDAMAGTAVAKPAHDAAYDAAYDKVALFNEHTWGAANPWLDAEDGGESGGVQWTLKSAIAYQAHDDAADLLHASTRRFGGRFGAAPDALASFLIVNPGPAGRTDVAEVFLPREIVPLAVPVTLVDARTGERVPHRESVVHPEDWPTRPIGRKLRAVVPDVAGMGFARLDVRSAQTPAPEPVPIARDGVIENEFYRVCFDAEDGVIGSVFDKAAGRELVNAAALAGFGQYVHDTYGTAPHVNHLSGHVLAPDKTLLSGREIGRRAVVTRAERSEIGERLVAELAGEGADWLRLTIELHRNVPRVDITFRLAKRANAAKESVFLAFPFAMHGPPAAWELTGGIGGSEVPRVPGSAEHMAVVRHWVAFEDHDLTVAWATLEAPLVQLGTIHMPYAPFPPTLDPEPGTIYSWALTNIWDTNFPAQQSGEMTFRYAVASAPGSDSGPGPGARRLGAATAAGLTDPLLAVLATSLAAPAPAAGTFCAVDHPDVLVTSIGRSRQGHQLLLRLRSLAAETVRAEVLVPGAAAGRTRVEIPACGVVELAVDLDAAHTNGTHEDH